MSTSTFAFRSKFPSEILSRVFEYLDVEHLRSTSLVSHRWYQITFSHLNRSMTIWRARHLQRLIHRLELESSGRHRAPQLSICLRSLHIDISEMGRKHEEAFAFYTLMPRFKAVMPKLIHLQHLDWDDTRFGDYDPEFDQYPFKAFRDFCPNLRMFTRQRYVLNDIRGEVSAEQVFVFKKMTHLDVACGVNILEEAPDFTCILPPPRALSKMIENSPDLVELGLSLHSNIFDVLCGLKNPLSKLRKLKLSGPVARLPLRSDSDLVHPLSSFFEAHPHIETVELRFEPEDRRAFNEHIRVGMQLYPEIAAEPPLSLKHFIGPSTLCKGVLTSRVAAQLESLTVINPFKADSKSNPEPFIHSVDVMAQMAWSLPHLTELTFEAKSFTSAYASNHASLEKILRAAPGLTKLNISCFRIKQANLLQLLAHVPLLEEISIRNPASRIHSASQNNEQSDVFHNLLVGLKQTLPKLQRIRVFGLVHTNPAKTTIIDWVDAKGRLRFILVTKGDCAPGFYFHEEGDEKVIPVPIGAWARVNDLYNMYGGRELEAPCLDIDESDPEDPDSENLSCFCGIIPGIKNHRRLTDKVHLVKSDGTKSRGQCIIC